MTTQNKLDFSIRFMNGRDREEVLRVDRAAFRPALSAEELGELLSSRNTVAKVADIGHEVVGFIIYHEHPEKYIIERVAVEPEFARLGVGRGLVSCLCEKLSFTGRERVEALACDDNLRGHKFLQSCGFRAIAVLRQYVDEGHDAYLFEYCL